MSFNLYVSDLRDNLDPSASCSQYADDTFVYTHCAVKELESRASDLNLAFVKPNKEGSQWGLTLALKQA